MSRLATRAEIIKLARLLKLEEPQLAFLAQQDVTQIRALRERLSAALYDSSRSRLVRVAAASKLIPVALVATIGQKLYGPLLCARVTGLLAPARAVEVALKLSPRFLADVSVELDPRSAREVIALLPAQCVVAVAQELLTRREYLTMARFVDFLSDVVIREVASTIRDDRALLEIAFFIESPQRLETVIGLLPAERLRGVIRTAAGDVQGLWSEALSMMTQVSPTLRGRMGDLTAALDDAQLTAVIEAVNQGRLWGAWLTVLTAMSADAQRRVLALSAHQTPEALSALATAAREQGIWDQLKPMLALMSAAPRQQLEDFFGRLKSAVRNLG
ncbi:MAG: hypothetical protein E6R07_02855 [Nevskiaceae bacterium]|nr:MAG: hypothetical protein E6R07_02855 [Nevskiaceae bacterium]